MMLLPPAEAAYAVVWFGVWCAVLLPLSEVDHSFRSALPFWGGNYLELQLVRYTAVLLK